MKTPMSLATRWRRLKQIVKSAIKRAFGKPQPTLAEIAAAEQRVAAGVPGSLDHGNPQRDLCLARGYCCEKACRSCPWGWKPRRGRPIVGG